MFHFLKKLIGQFADKKPQKSYRTEHADSSYMDPETERILNGRHVERRIDANLERKWQQENQERREANRRLKSWGDDLRVLQAAAAANPNGSAAMFIKSGRYLDTMPTEESERSILYPSSTAPRKVASNRKVLSEAEEADRRNCQILENW